ncbi:MAG: transcriptional regulator GcvA [Pseudomonadota bacterium]
MARTLPALSTLRTFEAAARHESFKRAAAELAVTPTAVSHQVKQLERDVGQPLFHRRVRQVRLTEAGRLLLEACRESFDGLEAALARLRAGVGRARVIVGVGPLVAAKWLTPRLSGFWQSCPGVDLRLHHSPLSIDFRESDIDLAIAWGDGAWREVAVEPLLKIQVTPVMSPRLLADGTGLETPQDLLRYPLLHQRDRDGWREWFGHAGLGDPEAGASIVIEDAHVVLQAAIEGQGVALGIPPFIADDIAAGRLIRPLDLAIEPSRAYYLVYPKGALRNPTLKRLRDWLVAEAQG